MREVFVFGSNLAGRHGKGAALEAKNIWGAVNGVGEGPTGGAYAIPTKDHNLKTLPLKTIRRYVDRFVEYANGNPDIQFYVTPIGSGLAGHDRKDIADMFFVHKLPGNLVFTKEWFDKAWWRVE